MGERWWRIGAIVKLAKGGDNTSPCTTLTEELKVLSDVELFHQ